MMLVKQMPKTVQTKQPIQTIFKQTTKKRKILLLKATLTATTTPLLTTQQTKSSPILLPTNHLQTNIQIQQAAQTKKQHHQPHKKTPTQSRVIQNLTLPNQQMLPRQKQNLQTVPRESMQVNLRVLLHKPILL